MWLLRGLSFTCKALQNSQANKGQELATAFSSSYDTTLKKFHGLLVRPAFAVSYIASPCFFFFLFIAVGPLRRPSGSEMILIHIGGSAKTFFLG